MTRRHLAAGPHSCAQPSWSRICTVIRGPLGTCSAGRLGAAHYHRGAASGGIELLVLDGSFIESGEVTRLSWLRLPAGATLQATAGRDGCKVWVKSGHLAHEPRRPTAA